MLESINKLLLDVAPIFYNIVYMSLVASVVGLAILLVKKLFGKKLSPRVNGILWIVFVLALIIPIRIESSFSVYNMVPVEISNIVDISYRGEYDNIKYIDKLANEEALLTEGVDIGIAGYTKYINEAGNVDTQLIQRDKNIAYAKSLVFDCVLPAVYIVGVIVIGFFSIVSLVVFYRKIGKEYINGDGSGDSRNSRIVKILEDCKVELNIKRKVVLVEQDVVRVPALFGVLRPKLLVCDSIHELSDDQIKYICMHELAHYTKGDLLKNMVLNVLKVVYWFNPIVWLCFKHIRKDMEITTDNVAISHLPIDEHKDYCKVLLDVACSGEGSGDGAGADGSRLANRVLGISNDKKSLEGRITMIKNSEKFSKNKVIFGVVGVALIVLLGALFCTTKLSTVPPDLYATVNGNEYVQFVRGGYEWNTLFESVIADAPMPTDFEYSDESTIRVALGDSIRLTNVKNRYNLGGSKFYTSDVRYFNEDGEDIVFNEPIPLGSREAIIKTPNEPGTYILSINADYYSKGKVQYGIKVIVGYDMEAFKTYSNTYIGDAPRVNAILRMIQYCAYLNGIELHTANEPYSMTVNYNGVNLDKEELEFNSVVLFSLIQNLNSIEYVMKGKVVDSAEGAIEEEAITNTINVSRGMYASVATLNYDGLVEYIGKTEERLLIKQLKDIYLPIYTHQQSYLDLNDDGSEFDNTLQKDSLMMESIIWGYYTSNPNANDVSYAESGEYPREMVAKVYYEMTGKYLDNVDYSLGIYRYIEDKDCFLVAADWNMPLITKVDSVQKHWEGGYAVSYQYCYPSERDILNLPMNEIEPGHFTLDDKVYQQYINGLKKYNAWIELKENEEYDYIKWQLVNMGKM